MSFNAPQFGSNNDGTSAIMSQPAIASSTAPSPSSGSRGSSSSKTGGWFGFGSSGQQALDKKTSSPSINQTSLDAKDAPSTPEAEADEIDLLKIELGHLQKKVKTLKAQERGLSSAET